MVPQTQITEKKNDWALVLFWPLQLSNHLDPYSRTSYDISWASDWSRWPSRPIRSLRYIITCTRIRALPPSKPRSLTNASLMFGQRRGPWAKSKPAFKWEEIWRHNMCKYVPAFAMVSPQINQGWLIVGLTGGYISRNCSLNDKSTTFYIL